MSGLAVGIPTFKVTIPADSVDAAVPATYAMEGHVAELPTTPGEGGGEGPTIVVVTSNTLGTGAPVSSVPVAGDNTSEVSVP